MLRKPYKIMWIHEYACIKWSLLSIFGRTHKPRGVYSQSQIGIGKARHYVRRCGVWASEVVV